MIHCILILFLISFLKIIKILIKLQIILMLHKHRIWNAEIFFEPNYRETKGEVITIENVFYVSLIII